MACACRTKSLSIFVQSLTDLRVVRSAQLNHFSLLVTRPHAQARHSTRLFSSTPAAYYPRKRVGRIIQNVEEAKSEEVEATEEEVAEVDVAEASTVEASAVEANVVEDSVVDEKPLEEANASESTAAETVVEEPIQPAPVVLQVASENELAEAKSDGAIFEFNPDNIDSLIAGLKQATIDANRPELEYIDPEAHTQSEESRRPKPPVGPSQLKRLKLEKDETKSNKGEEPQPRFKEHWQAQKAALKEKFPEGWNPRKRLSPDALDGIRALNAQFPHHYTLPVLAEHFKTSPEAIRRILKSKWRASEDEEMDRQERWFKRGMKIWSNMAELGIKPPRKWRQEGVVRDPRFNQKKGPRTEYPYVRGESASRKLSGSLL